MKESFKKIAAWIKAHPIPAAIIGLVVVVVGYFVVKSSGGNSSGESINGGALGADEASPLVGLGGGGMSTGGSTPSTGTTPESIPTSGGGSGVAAYNDISTPSAAESIGTFGGPSDFVNDPFFFSGPTPAAEVFNNVQKSTLAESGFAAAVSSAPTGNKNYGPALVSTNTGQPATLTRLGIASTLSNLSAPIKAPTLASILPVVTKPTPYVAPKPSVNTIFSNALTKPATPRFDVLKYVGNVSGYKWDSKLRRYVRLTSTAQPLKAY